MILVDGEDVGYLAAVVTLYILQHHCLALHLGQGLHGLLNGIVQVESLVGSSHLFTPQHVGTLTVHRLVAEMTHHMVVNHRKEASAEATQITAPKGSAPKTKEQKRREAEARNRAYAALKGHRKRIEELDKLIERDQNRLDELNAIFADPTFYTREDSTTDVINEHVQVKKRLAAYEEEWFLLNEELEEELARQKGDM